MICCSASNYIYLIEIFYVLFRHSYAIKIDASIFIKPPVYSLINSLRLFMYLLKHKMLVAFLFGCISIPCHMEHVSVDFLTSFIVNSYIIFSQYYRFIVFYKIYLSYIFKQSRNIGGYEIESFSYPCY